MPDTLNWPTAQTSSTNAQASAGRSRRSPAVRRANVAALLVAAAGLWLAGGCASVGRRTNAGWSVDALVSSAQTLAQTTRAEAAEPSAVRKPQPLVESTADDGPSLLPERTQSQSAGSEPLRLPRARRVLAVRAQQPDGDASPSRPGRAHCDGYWPSEPPAAEDASPTPASGVDAAGPWPSTLANQTSGGQSSGRETSGRESGSPRRRAEPPHRRGAAAFVVTDPSWLEGAPPPLQTGPPGRWEQVGVDLRGLLPSLGRDVQDAVNWKNAALLSAAAAVAVAVHQDWDGKVRQYTARHPDRWEEGSKTLGRLGQAEVQLPLLFGTYAYSVWSRNDQLHELALTAINAYGLTTTATVLLKAAVNTKRPSQDWNGGQFGFPSYHTSSSFAFAAVLDEYYGPKVGLPAFALAGLIGWSRIDERDHDLSDVLFGAALGYVIGKSVAKSHLGQTGCVRVVPFSDPDNHAAGLSVTTRF